MAGHAVGAGAIVRLIDEAGEHTVKNDGPGSCAISKDPQLSPTGATAFVLAANTEQDVTLQPGEALFAECPSGATAVLEVI